MLARRATIPTRASASNALRQRACRPVRVASATATLSLGHPSNTASGLRQASAGSSSRWLSRQGRDPFTRASKLGQLKSRAAFKLLEIDQKHRIFRPGQTVVDLGYAPGSWSQVAVARVRPEGRASGRVVGVDVIPAQPPRGVSTIQGNFLDPEVRQRVVDFVTDRDAGRPPDGASFARRGEEEEEEDDDEKTGASEAEQRATDDLDVNPEELALEEEQGRVVDVVLSDMNEPWPLASGSWLNSVSNPWRRMMNTSGNSFRDHAGSMDLCLAALAFSFDTLKTGGTFLCKFYQGAEDKDFEMRMKALFEKVHRVKPDSSRKESREAYFLGLRRKSDAPRDQVLAST